MTKIALKEKSRNILDKYFNTSLFGDSIVTDIQDHEFLTELIKGHRQYIEKIGCGVKYFYVDSDGRGSRCFHIRRTDDTSTFFSYNRCIDPYTVKSDIMMATRNSVTQTIINFKNEHLIPGTTTCPISGVILYNENTDVDHYDLTFNEMLLNWMNDKDENQILKSIQHGDYGQSKLKEPLSSEFIEYHNKNTHLRLVEKTVNRSILRKIKKGEQYENIKK